MAPERSFQFRPMTGLLLAVGIAFVALGIVYLTTAADKLPSLLPGHEAHVTRHHLKHGIAMFGVAAIAWVGAWFTTGAA